MPGRIQLKLGYEKVQGCIRSVDRTGWSGRSVFTSQSFIKKVQSPRFSEVRLLGRVGPGQGVKIGCQPALVLGEQAGNELRRRVGACSDQILPGGLGRSSPWDYDLSGLNTELTAVKIEDGRHRTEFLQPHRFLQDPAHVFVGFGERPVEPGQLAVVQKHVKDIRFLAFVNPRPVCRAKQYRDFRTGERMDEGLALFERLFQVCQRKPGIDSEESVLPVGGF